jgi:hypothetical protein
MGLWQSAAMISLMKILGFRSDSNKSGVRLGNSQYSSFNDTGIIHICNQRSMISNLSDFFFYLQSFPMESRVSYKQTNKAQISK